VNSERALKFVSGAGNETGLAKRQNVIALLYRVFILEAY
jgi:hypothetical protein